MEIHGYDVCIVKEAALVAKVHPVIGKADLCVAKVLDIPRSIVICSRDGA